MEAENRVNYKDTDVFVGSNDVIRRGESDTWAKQTFSLNPLRISRFTTILALFANVFYLAFV